MWNIEKSNAVTVAIHTRCVCVCFLKCMSRFRSTPSVNQTIINNLGGRRGVCLSWRYFLKRNPVGRVTFHVHSSALRGPFINRLSPHAKHSYFYQAPAAPLAVISGGSCCYLTALQLYPLSLQCESHWCLWPHTHTHIYTLPFKSLGSLRNDFIFQRKALFFQ